MAKTPLRKSPLQLPANSAEFLRTFVFDRPPTSDDYRNFRISDMWINKNPGGSPEYSYYILVDKPSGSAIWIKIGGAITGDVQSVTGNSGGPIIPDINGNINIIGGPGVTTEGSGNSLTINSIQYSDQSSSGSVESNSGSFVTSAITLTLPNSPSDGDICEFVNVVNSTFVIQTSGSQIIQLGQVASSAGGTATTTTHLGDSCVLKYRSSDVTWYSTSIVGNWVLA